MGQYDLCLTTGLVRLTISANAAKGETQILDGDGPHEPMVSSNPTTGVDKSATRVTRDKMRFR
jgi:hypothetical protein